MKPIYILLFLGITYALPAQQPALWLRYPAISPDGRTIVFSHRGDLYRVDARGGEATPLTVHPGHEFMPVWSPDGSRLAFASDRHGQFDVFIMPAEGGEANRLTYHSAGEFPTGFSADGQSVLFSAAILDAAANMQFPSGVLPELYAVPVQGGHPRQILTTPAQDARYNKDGRWLVYHDRKGYEDEWRKHHTSSVARDIWKYDTQTGVHTRLSRFAGEDRNPVFAPGEDALYYLSEAGGTFNIWRCDLQGEQATQLTFLDTHPVRHLSSSNDGLLCFSYNGELYTYREGAAPQRLSITLRQDSRPASRILPINQEITEVALSPNGKEVAFIFRGEVFAASVKEGTTRRITNTPEQERSVSFSPDGRSLLYAGERDGSWNLYRTRLGREDETLFFQSTLLVEDTLLATAADAFQPAWSPDGREVAFLEERTALRVLHLDTKKVRTILPGDRNYSYSDGDQHYAWSPDGQWFLVEFLQPRQWISMAGLVHASGKEEVINLTQSGYSDGSPSWALNGKAMLWASDRDGMKNDASWGGQSDAYALFFTQEAFDAFRRSKEEQELLNENKKEKEKSTDKESPAKTGTAALQLELDGIEDRRVRLTIHSSELADAVWTADGEKLYYLAKFEKGFDLWQTEIRTRETKILTKLGAGSAGQLQLDKEGKFLVFLADGSLQRVALEDGKKTPIAVSGEMLLQEAAERAYLFRHIVRQVDKKFYVTDLHGVDWPEYEAAYARFLPHIHNDYDFAEMLSELLGELNASHTGGRYRPNDPLGDKTASLGLFLEPAASGEGMVIREIMPGSPVTRSGSRIQAGQVIERINGEAILPEKTYAALLNRREGKPTRLSLYNPATRERWEEVVKPISLGEENELLYQRWVRRCRHLVDSLSGGRIGYVHVRGMNDPSYRTIYADALGRHANKEALVVDTRFNGGGWLHDDLVTFLDGKEYMHFRPRGQDLGTEPQFKWRRPSIVVMSEGNYSDAHMFPYTYKALGIGKLVGMPVPGTGTAVWWERLQSGLVFGIPQVGMVGLDGQYLENQELQPDIRVANDPGEVRRGRDQQLEAAVRELLQQLAE